MAQPVVLTLNTQKPEKGEQTQTYTGSMAITYISGGVTLTVLQNKFADRNLHVLTFEPDRSFYPIIDRTVNPHLLTLYWTGATTSEMGAGVTRTLYFRASGSIST